MLKRAYSTIKYRPYTHSAAQLQPEPEGRYNVVHSLNVPKVANKKLDVMLMCNSFNGLSKSVYTDLQDSGHNIVKVSEINN